MIKPLPDKWIRKAVYDAVNNMVVNTKTIPCFDSRAENVDNYVLLTSQSNEVLRDNKCEHHWESQILIEVFTTYSISGNPGSRLLADDIADEIRNRTDVLTLDVASGLEIIDQTQSFPSDLTGTTENANVHRKFIRIELLIN